MVARYVVPEVNGYLDGLRTSREFLVHNHQYFNRARGAVMAKITENATEALKVTKSRLLPAAAGSVSDFSKASGPTA